MSYDCLDHFFKFLTVRYRNTPPSKVYYQSALPYLSRIKRIHVEFVLVDSSLVCVPLAVRAAEFELSYSLRSEQSVGDRTPESKPQGEGYSIGDA